MHFHISRNGQVYGPYTLDDLRRYLASGNVLASDLARRDDMTEWLPVTQVLASYGGPESPGERVAPAAQPVAAAQAAGAYTSPMYAAPVYNPAAAAIATSAYPDPPNLPWWAVALIDLFTLGLFIHIWNIVIAAWVRRVQPNATSLFFYIAVLVLRLLSAGVSFHSMLLNPFWLHGGHYAGQNFNFHDLFLGLSLGSITWVIKLIARFSQKASLEQHFNGPEPIGLQLSGVMVFFFGGLYFQSELSRIVQMKRSARMLAGVPQY